MLTTFNDSYKTPLFSHNNGELLIGFLIDIVINSETGIFEAFWIHSIEGQKLLLPKDILSWNYNRIITEDIGNLSSPESLPRLKRVFEKECPILQAPVYQRSDHAFIGKVKNFTFDTISPRLLSIEVRKGFFGFSKRIISHKSIDKITKEGIWVLEPEVRIKVEDTNLKSEIKKLRKADLRQRVDKN